MAAAEPRVRDAVGTDGSSFEMALCAKADGARPVPP